MAHKLNRNDLMRRFNGSKIGSDHGPFTSEKIILNGCSKDV